jgi:iron complex transport system substrate-binding protein
MRGNLGKMKRWLAIFATISSLGGAHAADAPGRVVSFNLCADQLVLALANPGQIAGLSPYAADPVLSVMAERARDFPRLDWQAESVIPLKPDLLLTGNWDRPVTRRLLGSLGYRIAEVDVVISIDAARQQMLDVSALLGHPQRGEAMARELDATRRRLAAERSHAGTALVLERGGFASGSQTIAAALLAEAGLRAPPGAPGGIGGFLPLEKLLMLKPDYVVLKDAPREATDQGALYLTHPALRGAYPPDKRIRLPARYALCGGPSLIAAMNYLEGELKRLR